MKRPYTRRADGTVVDAKWQARMDRLRANRELISRLGLAHRWNSESARRAANKMWKTKRKGKSGRRLGFPAKLTPRIDHQMMREYYSKFTEQGISYNENTEQWERWASADELERYCGQMVSMSERAALTRLGHLKPRKR